MKQIKIEKGIPIPEADGRGRGRVYPFPEMEVGDSVLIKGKTATAISGPIVYARKRSSLTTGEATTGWSMAV